MSDAQVRVCGRAGAGIQRESVLSGGSDVDERPADPQRQAAFRIELDPYREPSRTACPEPARSQETSRSTARVLPRGMEMLAGTKRALGGTDQRLREVGRAPGATTTARQRRTQDQCGNSPHARGPLPPDARFPQWISLMIH